MSIVAEIFTSVYKKDYRGHPNHKRVGLLVPLDIYSASNQDDHYIQLPDKHEKEWSEKSDEIIRRMYLNRLNTTYRVSYCRDREAQQNSCSSEVKSSNAADPGSKQQSDHEDVLISHFSKLYALPKTQKLLPPLPTSRRVNGYCRPALLYTQLSDYQASYCKTGFDILKKDFDRGINRLSSKRKTLDDIKIV